VQTQKVTRVLVGHKGFSIVTAGPEYRYHTHSGLEGRVRATQRGRVSTSNVGLFEEPLDVKINYAAPLG
jgi:hypothetical protein